LGAARVFSGGGARGRRWLLLVSAWLGVVAAVALATMVVTAGAHAGGDSCPERVALSPGTKQSAPDITYNEDKRLVIRIDAGSNGAATDQIALTADGRGLTRRDFDKLGGLRPMVSDDGYLTAGEHEIGAAPAFNGADGVTIELVPLDPRTIVLCMLVDPSVDSPAPGRYSGTVGIVYGSNQQQVLMGIPVELTLRGSRLTAIVVALIALLLGLTVKVLSEAAAVQHTENVSSIVALRKYVSQLTFPIVLILAIVVGLLVFAEMYVRSPDWDAGLGDVTALFAVCFVAQMSSNEGMNIVRRLGGGS